MSKLQIKDYGLEELTRTEMKELNGGWTGLTLFEVLGGFISLIFSGWSLYKTIMAETPDDSNTNG
ncbi:hypothetical protein GMMP15_650018 [Candidatus Magnetomoraceae bacterium gMMP-15]